MSGFPTVVDIPIEAQFEGLTYGLGGTLVGGYSHLFGMIDINYTWTDIPAFDNKIEKLVASGRIGLQGKVWRVGGAFWVGTMYLDNNQTIAITLPSGTGIPALDGARTEVDQDSDHSFNFIFGGLWEINRRIQLAIEGGVGERNQLMVSVGHRF